jgi:hypothetical protein
VRGLDNFYGNVQCDIHSDRVYEHGKGNRWLGCHLEFWGHAQEGCTVTEAEVNVVKFTDGSAFTARVEAQIAMPPNNHVLT